MNIGVIIFARNMKDRILNSRKCKGREDILGITDLNTRIESEVVLE